MSEERYGYESLTSEEWNGPQGWRCTEASLAVLVLPEEERADDTALTEAGAWERLYAKRAGLMKRLNCRYLLLLWSCREEERLLFISSSRRIRAVEFLDYLIGEFGLITGSAQCAAGRIASVILRVQLSALDLTDTTEYVCRRAAAYGRECRELEAADYAAQNPERLRHMRRYVKKRTAWAYVRSTDITEPGGRICVKTLENEAGLTVTAGADTYIMIGCRGEVYDISREKFERIYEPTEERLDIFAQMLDFLPAVETMPEGAYVSLDELARLCYPKPGSGILAEELTERTKIFPADGQQEYFLGRPGDYMAILPDAPEDIYVIQHDIFRQTYEEVE